MGSLKSAAFTDIGKSSLGDIDHEVAVSIDLSHAARSDDRSRLALLDYGRPCDFLADRQFVVIIDGLIGVTTELAEIDRTRALPGFSGLPAVRLRNLILLAAGAQAPGDHLDSGTCNGTAEQLAVELVEIAEKLL